MSSQPTIDAPAQRRRGALIGQCIASIHQPEPVESTARCIAHLFNDLIKPQDVCKARHRQAAYVAPPAGIFVVPPRLVDCARIAVLRRLLEAGPRILRIDGALPWQLRTINRAARYKVWPCRKKCPSRTVWLGRWPTRWAEGAVYQVGVGVASQKSVAASLRPWSSDSQAKLAPRASMPIISTSRCIDWMVEPTSRHLTPSVPMSTSWYLSTTYLTSV